MRNAILFLMVLVFVCLLCTAAPAGPVRDFFGGGSSSPCAGGTCAVPVKVTVTVEIAKPEKTVAKPVAKPPAQVVTVLLAAKAEFSKATVAKARTFLGKVFRRRGR